ncbi:MAG: DUF4136 domain-containing protein [Verrucomicrobiales bacterium]|nr:DUF4136 domain-containing protein [Verrucomicrobiales bacterium]
MKKKKTLRGVFAIATALLTSCATQEAIVGYNYTPEHQPDQFSSFSWLKEVESTDTLSNNLAILQTIQGSIGKQLGDKGFQKSTTTDFKLGMLIVDRDQGINYTLDRYFGNSLRGADISSVPSLPGKSLEQGTMILDAVNAKTGDVVWRGTAATDINRKNSPDVRTDKIEWIVSELLKSFPDPRP